MIQTAENFGVALPKDQRDTSERNRSILGGQADQNKVPRRATCLGLGDRFILTA